jgi:predicted kinase
MLIVFAGLPGAGKTTIARTLAQKLGAVHLRIDTIEQALRSSRVLKSDVGPAGYLVAQRVAEENLRIGRLVVADSVNPLQVTRGAWRAVAEQASTDVIEDRGDLL